MKFRYLLATFVALVGVLGLAQVASAFEPPTPSEPTEASEPAGVSEVASGVVEIDGVTIAIEKPGIDAEATPAADYTCHYKHLCTWHNGKFNEWYYCERIWLTNWTGEGWAVNNQTPGTTSHFYNQNGSRNFSLPDGYLATFNWDPIWSFQVC